MSPHDERVLQRPICLALTGASGAQYGLRLLQCLLEKKFSVHLLISDAAAQVIELETDLSLPDGAAARRSYLAAQYAADEHNLVLPEKYEWTAAVASGSNAPRAMVICPCSSGSLSAIATGASNNLIERAADVVIKERRQLVLVHREMPVSAIHLEHQLKLAQLGVTVMPASPGFYHRPQTVDDMVDFVVARILDHLQVPHALMQRWGA